MLTIYTLSHFLVDFACGWAIFHGPAYCEYGVACVLIYNFLAFAMQMPLGVIADDQNRNAIFAALGCIMVGLACILPLSPLIVVLIAGLGNALFHLGGGIDVLNGCHKRSGPLGIFVSTGAFGIFYGSRLGSTMPDLGTIIAIAVGLAAISIILQQWLRHHTWHSENAPLEMPHFSRTYILAALCLLSVVILRSFLGFALAFSWKAIAPWGTLALCAVVAGKMCGGLLADRLGMLTTCLVTLSVSALLFLFSAYPLAGVVAIWLFNMTMPMTLGALADISPGCKGLAFGTLTLGLFLGGLPHCLGWEMPGNLYLNCALVTLISMLLLWLGLRQADKCC